MQDSIQIRPAQPDDAKVAAILLSSAYTHTQVSSAQRAEQNSGWTKHLEHSFRRDDNRFSYQNIQVAEQNSKIVGLVLSFGGRDEARLNAAVGKWLEHEARDDEWYVDALAVFSDWGRKGIGTRLMHSAEQQARQHHYPKIALHVVPENKEALSLYTHLHYVITGQTFLYQHPYVRMVKTLSS